MHKHMHRIFKVRVYYFVPCVYFCFVQLKDKESSVLNCIKSGGFGTQQILAQTPFVNNFKWNFPILACPQIYIKILFIWHFLTEFTTCSVIFYCDITGMQVIQLPDRYFQNCQNTHKTYISSVEEKLLSNKNYNFIMVLFCPSFPSDIPFLFLLIQPYLIYYINIPVNSRSVLVQTQDGVYIVYVSLILWVVLWAFFFN